MRFIAVIAMVAVVSLAGAANIPLVKDGKSDWSIVVCDGADPAVALAASELARYIKLASGADLPIRSRGDAPRHTLIVSDARQATASYPILAGHFPSSPADPDSYSVSGGPDQLFVVGATGRSTLYAAYHVLDSMGCRFLAPRFDHYKGSAEVVPHSPDVSLPSDVYAETKPVLKFRKLYVEEGHSHTIDNLKQLVEWMPKVGYNTLVIPTNYQGHDKVKWDNWRKDLTPELRRRGITIEVGGHGYQNFLNDSMDGGTLFRKHPEYFGQDAKGIRHSDDHTVFCTSNPDAVRYLTGQFLAYVKDRPEIQIYDFWPPDGAAWCECDKCKALGSPSDRQAILLGQIKQSVAKVRPDLRLEMIAYSSYVTPPEHATVDPSVLVDFCPINQSFNWSIDDPASDRNAGYARDLAAWRKKFTGDISIYSYYRKYAWDSLPLVLPHYIQHDLKWYARLPLQGVSIYSEPGDWFTYELNHNTLAALAWNPDCDVDAVIHKFAAARYGPAAGAAITAYAALEDVVRTSCSVPYTPRKPLADLTAGQQRLQSAKDGVVAATSSAVDESVKYNLGRLALTLGYAIGDLRLLELAAAHDRDAARSAAHDLYKLLSDHEADGVFLTRNDRVNESHLLARTGNAARK